MRWFGKHPWAPVCEEGEQAPTPVGEPCAHCNEPIEADDDGVLMPHIEADTVRERPLHYECNLRTAIGSVNHILRHCSCYIPGALETDPPELTPRQAAKLAVELWEKDRLRCDKSVEPWEWET